MTLPRNWARADEDRQKLKGKWADYFTAHDVLITPAAPTAAVDGGCGKVQVCGQPSPG